MVEPGGDEARSGGVPAAFPATEQVTPAAATPPPPEVLRFPVEFTATAGEYFRIWIVNLVLTLLTLGIYSAWAKVRVRRYFYGHTKLGGESFEFRGQPLAILKGRLIAVAAFGVYFTVRQFAPGYHLLLLIPAIFVLPWLLVRTLAFNAANTAYRNIRFRFCGTYRECLKFIVGYGLLMIVTFGIGFLYLKARLVRFAADNHRYGMSRFRAPDVQELIQGVYWRAMGTGLLLVFTFFVALAINRAVLGKPDTWVSVVIPLVATASLYIGYLYVYAYVRAGIANTTFNQLRVGPVRFEFTQRPRELWWLYLVNILAIIVTLGLATPWAKVRIMRYRAAHATVIATGGLDQFVAAEAGQVNAAGEEMAEMFDLDFGL